MSEPSSWITGGMANKEDRRLRLNEREMDGNEAENRNLQCETVYRRSGVCASLYIERVKKVSVDSNK